MVIPGTLTDVHNSSITILTVTVSLSLLLSCLVQTFICIYSSGKMAFCTFSLQPCHHRGDLILTVPSVLYQQALSEVQPKF